MWTLAGGTVDLGTLPFGAAVPAVDVSSHAYGISADGTVIVGDSITGDTVAKAHNGAFRYTVSDHTMRDMGALDSAKPAAESYTAAYATNTDGSVVVGTSTIAGSIATEHAFRWVLSPGTTAGVMTDIDGRAPGNSFALAVDLDGSVVLGGMNSGNVQPFVSSRAFRWTQASGMVSLGTLAGTNSSVATAVDGDGQIVVGYAGGEAFDPHVGQTPTQGSQAFRWTAATGIQSLQTLLTNAGVNTTGITLLSANSITSDGQYIAGAGLFADTSAGSTSGYLARYCDATNMAACTGVPSPPTPPVSPPTPPIAGATTAASVQASIDQVAAARRMILVQEFGEAAQLLGANERIGSGSEIGVFAAGGTDDSLDGGAAGRAAYGNGVSILAGLASGEEHYGRANTDSTFMGALAVRYIYDTGAAWRPYGEAGAWGVPGANFTFTRTYANGSGTSTGSESVSATKYYAYGRIGTIFTPSLVDEVAFAIEVGHGALQTGGFAEAFSAADPFQATGSSATDEVTAGKIRAQWTHGFTKKLDATVWAAGADAFDDSSTFAAGVPGFGTVTPTRGGRPVWAEYGGRMGYKFTPATVVDVFADGVSGDRGIGTDVRIGAGFRYTF